MKTLTIKQEMVDELDSDENKLRFANDIISVFTEHEPITSSDTVEALRDGLNVDLPPLQIRAEFDSKNMGVTEIRRYHLAQSGYVPVSLDCGYKDYKYRRLDNMSDSELRSFFLMVEAKMSRSKGKRAFLKFLRYLHFACSIYCIEAGHENCLTDYCYR